MTTDHGLPITIEENVVDAITQSLKEKPEEWGKGSTGVATDTLVHNGGKIEIWEGGKEIVIALYYMNITNDKLPQETLQIRKAVEGRELCVLI